MGNSIHRRLDIYDHDYHKPFSFQGKKFKCKILEIISTNRLRVVFYFKKKPYTWKVELTGCNNGNIINNEDTKRRARSYVYELVRAANFRASIICGEIDNGFIKVIMTLDNDTTTLNDILIDSGYSFSNIIHSNHLIHDNILTYSNTYDENNTQNDIDVNSNTNDNSNYTNASSNFTNSSLEESEIQVIINSPPHTSSNVYEIKNNQNNKNIHFDKKEKRKKTKFNKVTPLHVPDEINFLKEGKNDYSERHIKLDNKVESRIIDNTSLDSLSSDSKNNKKDPFFSELSDTLRKRNVN